MICTLIIYYIKIYGLFHVINIFFDYKVIYYLYSEYSEIKLF